MVMASGSMVLSSHCNATLVGCDNRTGIPGAANEFFLFRGWLLSCLHRVFIVIAVLS